MPPRFDTDTIAAVSTPPGQGAIGVIRLSGPNAVLAASRLFHPRGKVALPSVPSHQALLGRLFHPRTGAALDEALCTVMRAPRSYTGEDMVEISGHGNPRLLSRILQLLLEERVRLAEPGEFTKRAFLNGKMDLTQAEGVMDAVSARTAAGMESALNQLEGKLGKFLKEIRGQILSLVVPLEACIDFPEEEVPETSRNDLEIQIGKLLAEIQNLLHQTSGRILREGVSAVIVGKPNVGKSSLLNALLGEGRAIVTEIPGTTRDTLEEWVEIHGIPVQLVDTAGIRSAPDRVEQLGILRSKEALAKGELILLMLDRSAPLEPQDVELLEAVKQKRSIVILNKIDLPALFPESEVQKFHSGPFAEISLLRNEGVESLQDQIVETVLNGGASRSETPSITRIRHQAGLERACRFLEESRSSLRNRLPFDLAALDLRGAAEAIGELTGECYTDDLLEKIFSEFCVGK